MKEITDRLAVTPDGRVWRKAYSITRGDGHVMSFKEKEYKTSRDRSGYAIIMNQGVNYKVHRLVAESFIPNPNNLPDVNHKNGIRDDNRVENLEWVSKSDNHKHAYSVLNRSRKVKLSDEEILQIYKLRNVEGLMLKEIAPMFGVCCQTVSHISKGNRFILRSYNETN